MNDYIQMAQVWTFQGLIQLINMYVMTDEDWVILGSDSALRKISAIFNEELECILLDDFNLHYLSWGDKQMQCADETV